jgi:hypothetical protein
MSQAKFVILVISDDGHCSKRRDLEEKLSKVIDSSSYAVADYYDQSSEVVKYYFPLLKIELFDLMMFLGGHL